MTLPLDLHRAAQVRALDASAIAAGTPGIVLMERAARAALQVLQEEWPGARHVTVVCGAGNNGGDGYFLAALACRAGLEVCLLDAAPGASLRGDAALAAAQARACGLVSRPFTAALLAGADVVVDAVLGIGTTGTVRADTRAVIDAINAAGRPVLSLDLPSGLEPDHGAGEVVVRATATVCFVALKAGLFLGQGPEVAGRLRFDALGIDSDGGMPWLRRLAPRCIAEALPPRRREAHKGETGSVLVVGGGTGMPGAVALAAEAALRVGAGRVTVASLPEHLPVVVGRRPELMFTALPAEDAGNLRRRLAPAVAAAEVLVLGPGLGRQDWGRQVMETVLALRRPGQPLVVDADGLYWLATQALPVDAEGLVLTPHPGEAARLLGSTSGGVQADRRAALQALLAVHRGIVVLKGAGTLVGGGPDPVPALCDRGNPGMAVAGMGDVLAGAVAGILAQGCPPRRAAEAAVLAHALAGDLLAGRGQRGLLAGDLALALTDAVNQP